MSYGRKTGIRIRTAQALVAAVTLVLGAGVHAQPAKPKYPSKVIRLVVPVTPGGSTDVVARIAANKMSELLGYNVLLDHRPGMGAIIGTDLVARSAPDGYTLLLAFSPHITTPFMYKKVPYDTLRDFAPVSMLATQPIMIVINPAVQARSVKELIAHAKANPGKLNYGLAGSGSSGHLAGELFKMRYGLNIVPIPYQGAGGAMTALASNEVQILFTSVLNLVGILPTGKALALGIASDKRSELFPNVPTFAELGLEKFDVQPWQGIVVPAKTPRAVIDVLNDSIGRALKSPDVVERLRATGSVPMHSTPEHFGRRVEEQMREWGRILKAANVKPE